MYKRTLRNLVVAATFDMHTELEKVWDLEHEGLFWRLEDSTA